MQNCKHFLLPLFLLLVFCDAVSAQELPPIAKYSPNIYGAGNQNWMIGQDKKNFLFFANNDGLLEYNGSFWTLHSSPNETIIRSVKVVGDKIYSGSYMEFGYWTRQADNRLKYFSLSQRIKSQLLDDEQFWNILQYDHWIIFQSLDRIYIYDTKSKTFSIVKPQNKILKAFETRSGLYFQVSNEGLFEIDNGKSKLVSNNPFVLRNKIIAIFLQEDGILINTQQSGFALLNSGKITQKFPLVSNTIGSSSVYSCIQLSDNSFAIGTISNGIFIVSESGNIKYHITQSKGISNNTVLALYEDIDKNLWVGLDNGINCINLKSPIRNYYDTSGFLGTIYTTLLFNQNLYIGTNQGLFFKKYNSEDDFKLIKETKGQVWSVFEHQGTLFCGHDSGTFIIENGVANLIYNTSGTWKFEKVPGNNNYILQGNYSGISVLEKKNNKWVYKNKISGFDYSAKYFEIMQDREVYVSHEYKGIFSFTVDKEFLKIDSLKAFKSPEKGKNASLAKFKNELYYANKSGIYKLNKQNKSFEKDRNLSVLFLKDTYTSGKLIVDQNDKMWIFTKNYINYFTNSKLSSQLKNHAIPISSQLSNSMLGYENITQLSNSNYLIGTTDSYYTINLNDLNFKSKQVSISNITFNKIDEKPLNGILNKKGDFDADLNNVTFNYTVPEFNTYIYTEYQYILEGFEEKWSAWSSKTTTFYKNLPPGNYTFKVRSKIANSNPENSASYSFTIHEPWYSTSTAFITYFIFTIILIWYVNKSYNKSYKDKEQKLIEENNLLLEIASLENERQLMKIKNEQLSSDMDSKNKELAISTMSLIKKDELLNLIKKDLKQTSTESANKNIKSLITTINKNITEEDSWNVFKEAFDNADTDFLKKIKQAHPSLTPNDLRLCAYLRLNLSSKEIAPLLNISVRSVEIKRYRLRKKMDLSHEQGLVEYILGI